ncbi:MAG: IclR family transcriptional regulator [Hyphomicrobiales bacterium]|nr:IclR family transcriptional regulator [Hyphomicrobiales bacterium]
MRILHAFTRESPELSVSELSAQLGLHKSDVSRLVSSLSAWRMLEKDPFTRRVRIAEGAYRLGSLYLQDNDVGRIAKRHMADLVAQTGHSAHVMVLDGDRLVVVATVESPSALRVIMRLGEHRELHSTAAGKLFLAHSDDLLAQAAAHGLKAFTPDTLSTPTRLKATLRKIRAENLAWNRGENSVGAGAVAAPILDSEGKVVAALSTVFPLHVVNKADSRRIAAATVAKAREISRQLGHKNSKTEQGCRSI